VELKRKYEEGSDYMEGIATTTVNQNILIEMRRPTGLKQSKKYRLYSPLVKSKDTTSILMPTAGLLMVNGLFPKKDQG
jgi:hypothetical protein